MMKTIRRDSLCLLVIAWLSGCSLLASEPAWKAAVAGDGPGDPGKVQGIEPRVSNLPKSRSGNPRQYSVFGQAYEVMDSARGFRERGEASWYGRKFHGRPTASGEIYDMHQMTAAHKHLPLPTFVRVTRIDNGQSVVVKVNDRGPFVGDRIIDLSYAAAVSLGMQDGGKTDVIIEALSTDEPESTGKQETIARSSGQRDGVKTVVRPAAAQAGSEFSYLQVGAYSESPNAEAMLASLRDVLDVPASILHDSQRNLYRVRIGPLADPRRLQQARDSLALAGIDSYTISASSR